MIPEKTDENKSKITEIGITKDTLTARAGLMFLSRYVQGTSITAVLAKKFSFLRKSSKGHSLSRLLKKSVSKPMFPLIRHF